jgi:hypothetical protein
MAIFIFSPIRTTACWPVSSRPAVKPSYRRSTPINADQRRSTPINADQRRSTPINADKKNGVFELSSLAGLRLGGSDQAAAARRTSL